MPKANAAPSDTVNVAVWVMNPGPMAEVAIRKIAPSSEPFRAFTKPPAPLPVAESCWVT